MPAGISAFSVPEAAAAPVCNATTTDAGRKRKRSKQKADAIAVKSEELEPLPVLQSATGYPATGTDHSVPEPASSQQGGITDAKALVKLETTAAAEVLHHTVPETSTQAPAKARKVKQTKAKATLIKKQSQSEKPHADLNVSTAAHAVTDDANQASTHKSKQATSKAAVKQEPAELDQPANTALNTAAAASPAAVPAADKPASGRNKNKTKAVIKDEPAELDQQADAAATAVADGPLTDAHEAAPAAAPARKPRKPRAKAAVKVDIAEVIASLDLKPYRDRVKPRKWVGAHVSMAAGLERAVVRAAAIGKQLSIFCTASAEHLLLSRF